MTTPSTPHTGTTREQRERLAHALRDEDLDGSVWLTVPTVRALLADAEAFERVRLERDEARMARDQARGACNTAHDDREELRRALPSDAAALEAAEADVLALARALLMATAPQACDGSGHTLIYHFGESGDEEGSENVPCDGCCACCSEAVQAALSRPGVVALLAQEGGE